MAIIILPLHIRGLKYDLLLSLIEIPCAPGEDSPVAVVKDAAASRIEAQVM